MTPSQRCYDLIKQFEGYSATAYPDPKTGGKPWTIGYGSTMWSTGKPVLPGDTITEAKAEVELKWHVDSKAAAIGPLKVNQNQYDAIVSFVYNLGIGNWVKSTLRRKVNLNPADPSIRDEFMKWVSPGSSVEKGLRRRRHAEADLYFIAI